MRLFIRIGLWLVARVVYRVRVRGVDNLPARGGALLASNHISYVDAILLLAACPRPIHFLMGARIYRLPWVRPFAEACGVIPLDKTAGPAAYVRAFKEAQRVMDEGGLVGIFPEGGLTHIGHMQAFQRGFEVLLRDLDKPIAPVHLGGLWGSVFSFSEGRAFWKLPKRLPYPVTLSFGGPLPHDAKASEVRAAIQQLGTEAIMETNYRPTLLHRYFVKEARKRPFKTAIADSIVPKLSFFKTYVGSLAFARKLKQLLDGQPMTGVLLPQSVGGVLTNVALDFLGRTPVNLNYTASNEAMASAARQCEITQVITAKALLERVPVEVPGEAIYLEDVKKSVTGKDRLVAMLMAVFLPVRVIEKMLGHPPDRGQEDLATVIFSSGSEGEPKGVMLTQKNIISNIQDSLKVFPFGPSDCLLGILPFFHSFGFTATLWLPLCAGMTVVYHPNPLEAKAIGEKARDYGATILIGTPTFLQTYIRRIPEDQFADIKYVITGAEKLPARIRNAFHEKYGVMPLEGYGATETGPIVSFNVPDKVGPRGEAITGTKHGTIGHPIPNVSARVVSVETGEVLVPNEEGMLEIKGPNVMKGYLKQPERTDEKLNDGWYETGDMASIDADGFITITGRLARFSKIAGEMVPHGRVEEELHRLLGLSEQRLSVMGVPDEKRGERLLVLHTLDDNELEELKGKLSEAEIPNLWLPKLSDFQRIDEIPVLGTGKLDIKALKREAEAAAAASPDDEQQ